MMSLENGLFLTMSPMTMAVTSGSQGVPAEYYHARLIWKVEPWNS